VIDARGDGQGWRVAMALSTGVYGDRIAATETEAQARCSTRSSCTLPSPGPAYPLGIPADGTGAVIFSAGHDSGMGSTDVSLNIRFLGLSAAPLPITVTFADGP
jgi:hypothetical protein